MAEGKAEKIRPQEKPSEATMERFRIIAAELIQEKLDELSERSTAEVTPQEVIAAVDEIGMTPANDRMSDETMRDLLSRGDTIEIIAKKLLNINGEA